MPGGVETGMQGADFRIHSEADRADSQRAFHQMVYSFTTSFHSQHLAIVYPPHIGELPAALRMEERAI